MSYGDQSLCEHYDFSQPWNSESNLAVARAAQTGMQPKTSYQCPGDAPRGLMDTTFVMPVGPGSISDGTHATSPKAITDGTSHTVFAVEMADSGICWTEPRDLNISEMSDDTDDYFAPSVRSRHAKVVNALMADGSAQSIRKDVDPKVLRGLFTISGGECNPSQLYEPNR